MTTPYINTSSADNPENPESESELRDLKSEIRSLHQSGEDPARLRKLCEKMDSHHLRVLNHRLSLLSPPAQEKAVKYGQVQEAFLLALELAITRTDLTVGEMLLLLKTASEAIEPERQFLLALKKAFERQLQAGKRRRRMQR